ncbi:MULTISPECIES: Bax inhibitor-1/YccA family protein [unclassified Brachybacterium]|uniref:Bax inhibitor-1/YccA family protein n=1 Tax=unclassified Brachybacterium TaxID=2623841 RepID=UPI000C7FE0BB|nr:MULTISPECIES: Bax inhibitor-1/YccA family protein [unclassified Brachybacterium]PMC75589.1 hypothetical protein CJ197_07560 [Brachybacterium sp. UMB0905]
MARHNIVFGRDQSVQSGAQYRAPQFGQSPQGGPGTQWSSDFGQQASTENLEAMYARPAASGYDTGRMTLRDALNAITASLGLVIVIGGGITLLPHAFGLVAGEEGQALGAGIGMLALVVGLLGALVVGLVNAFRRKPSAILTLLYAGFEGLLLGGLSAGMEIIYPGIALQAVTGTLIVAGTVLVLFRVGVLRTSPRLNKIFFVAMIAYLLFGLVNIVLLIATGQSLRDGMLGLAIGGLAVAMASYSLVMDFEDIQNAAAAGVPRPYAWRVAFGVTVTMVWMYVEVLRILAILRGD